MDADALDRATAALVRAGCVAAPEEAGELVAAAAGDLGLLDELLGRRGDGEPLAWLVGRVQFCGETVLVDPGVYVPRWQSEPLVLGALARLPDDGRAVDLCTGSGAVAVVLGRRRPRARVVATEIDPLALACARRNGVEVYGGDLAAALPGGLVGDVDVVTAVVPYVPTGELRLLPRDVVAHEPRRALDGGADGTDVLRRATGEAAALLRAGGWLALELGGDQADLMGAVLERAGFSDPIVVTDEDGDVRGLLARR